MNPKDVLKRIQQFPGRVTQSYRYRRDRYTRNFKNKLTVIRSPKIFCIGMNKTGTSSVSWAVREFGFEVGDQEEAEKLLPYWVDRKFQPIIRYCEHATFFQDIPFSLPETYKAMDEAFEDSKFILTVRNSADEWYRSVYEFDRLLSKERDGQRPGYSKPEIWNTPEDNVLDQEVLIETYERHNRSVLEYFKDRTDDLLVLNAADDGAYQKLCNFLGVEGERDELPWLNKTSEFS